MHGKAIFIGLSALVLALILLLPGARGLPEAIPHDAYFAKPGGTADVSISVTSDETTNYTVKLEERPKFEIVGNNTLTKHIYNGDTERFIFEVKVLNGTGDGSFQFTWHAYKNGSEFDSGNLEVKVGRGGGEDCAAAYLATGLAGLGAVFTIKKRK